MTECGLVSGQMSELNGLEVFGRDYYCVVCLSCEFMMRAVCAGL